MNRKDHWENIYNSKKMNEVSWYQLVPKTSLNLISSTNVALDAAIIDIGGGDSFLVDHLLDMGYTNVTVLDISEKAIIRAQERLGEKSKTINWIVSDVVDFVPEQQYDVWHDRAAFHFLKEGAQIEKYKEILKKGVAEKGHFIVGTFSETGPDRCSGIDIKKYSEEDLILTFKEGFDLVEGFNEVHDTPFETKQNFVFVHLIKRK